MIPRGVSLKGAHELADLLVVHRARTESIDVDGDRFGHADGARELHLAAIREAGCDDVLRDVAGHVASRAIDLGWVFARKRATTVRRGAAVGVDDDLAAGDAGVAVGPPTTKRPVGLIRYWCRRRPSPRG